jgi:molybdopterin-guanine dinucleotide biosynthesis protein A
MTTEGKAKRHGKLPRTSFGTFGGLELALLGAPCSYIQQFAEALSEEIAPVKCAYADADHAEDTTEGLHWNFRAQQAQNAARFETGYGMSREIHRLLSSATQVTLLNGNHFEGPKQLVLLHPEKLESLQRKLHKLIDPIGIVLCGMEAVPEFMQVYLREKGWELPIWKDAEKPDIAAHIAGLISVPRLRGLVLAGGKSERMGFDKTLIDFRGMPHRDYMLGLFTEANLPVMLSVRDEPESTIEGREYLVDRFRDMGPYGAIVSAFMYDPDAAWLVLASDLALFDGDMLAELIAAREPRQFATSFRSPVNGDAEPLAAIWEPSAYPWLLLRLSLGESCPRSVLRSLQVNVIEAKDGRKLMNVNTPEELERAKGELGFT